MPDTQTVQITCPNCRHVFRTPVRSVIDVGQQPELREALLAGQVNVAVCPKCHTGGLLEMPLIYHDPAAEFLGVYFPPQLNIPELEKQRMIGELTQSLMRSLPADQRKGYFLSPRQFASRQGLLDGVLGTMGISQEELDRQRKKMKLAEQLLVMADDAKGLQMMIKGQDSQLDYEFFVLLDSMLAQATAAGDEKSAQRLRLLRENLLPQTSFGRRAARQRAAVESLKDLKSPEEFLDKLIAADPDEVTAIAVSARPLLDYAFFQKLTDRVDASQGAERDRLAGLRDHLLDVTAKLDDATRAGVEASVRLLSEIVNSPSPRAAVREHAGEIDDLFMSVLSANMERALKENNVPLAERLQMIYEEVMALIQEDMPPEVQLINELLAAPYPDGTRALLKEYQEQITPEVLDLMDRMTSEFGQRKEEQFIETAKRLRDIRAQAMLMV